MRHRCQQYTNPFGLSQVDMANTTIRKFKEIEQEDRTFWQQPMKGIPAKW